jgi:UrcA family protein
MKFSKKVSTGFVALALTLSMGAGAAMVKGTHSATRVDLSDLDLTHVDGQQIMEARLKRAAKKVCGSQDVRTAGSLENVRKNKACFNDAFSSALDSVENHYQTASVTAN